MNARRLFLLSAFCFLLFDGDCLSATPTTLPTRKVGWLSLHDQKRNRDLPVTICYPDDSKLHPLVIFSHGAYGSALNAVPLAEFWASYGFICILPTHADSLLFLDRNDNNDPWTGPHDFSAYGKPATQNTWKPIWLERPRDIIFILDSLDEIERRVPPIRGRIDRSRIAMAGHSLGAYTAMLVTGARIDIPAGERNFTLADKRFCAIILLSPMGRGQQGLRDGSWDELGLPMLMTTGTYDVGTYDQPPAWREEPYLLSPPGDKFLLFLPGANHNSAMGVHVEQKDSKMPLQRKGETDDKLGEAIFADVKLTTLKFLQAYVEKDPAAKRWLFTPDKTQFQSQAQLSHR